MTRAKRTSQARLQVRVSVTESSVLYRLLAALPTESTRREALLSLATAQLLRESSAVNGNDARSPSRPEAAMVEAVAPAAKTRRASGSDSPASHEPPLAAAAVPSYLSADLALDFDEAA